MIIWQLRTIPTEDLWNKFNGQGQTHAERDREREEEKKKQRIQYSTLLLLMQAKLIVPGHPYCRMQLR